VARGLVLVASTLVFLVAPGSARAVTCHLWAAGNNGGFMSHNLPHQYLGTCSGWRQHGNFIFTGYAKNFPYSPPQYNQGCPNLAFVQANSANNGAWATESATFGGYGWEQQVSTPWYFVVTSGYKNNAGYCVWFSAI
jgi:hypothetical protein